MKMENIKNKLKMELMVWFTKQCENVYADYYLYYCEQCNEYDGGFMICTGENNGGEFYRRYKLATGERIRKGKTIEQNFNWLIDIVWKLPILDTVVIPSEGE